MNPTLVTPGPQPVEAAGSGADDARQVLRGEVVGPRHARRRPVDHRRKAAAGAILLSATGAATALFLMMGKDARDATASPKRDTSSATPDEAEAHTRSLGESAVGDTPLRGSRSEEPEPAAPAAAKPTERPPAAGSGQDGTRSPSSGRDHSQGSRPTWPSPGRGEYGDWQDEADELSRWAREYAEQQRDRDGSGSYGQGQYRYGDGYGYEDGYGYGDADGYGGSGRHGGGHRR